jgi:hypothetical protein
MRIRAMRVNGVERTHNARVATTLGPTPPSSASSGEPDRLFTIGGQAAATDEGFYDAVQGHMGNLAQIKHLSILIGAGASYALGSPRIRQMTLGDIKAMLEKTGQALSVDAERLLDNLVQESGGTIDLEDALGQLSSAVGMAKSGTAISAAIGNDLSSIDQVRELRRGLNHALATACDLPNLELISDAALREDPLRDHRRFFTKILRARRSDLPRLRVFTLNYDQVVEKSLDQLGIQYSDGFAGNVERVFRPDVFERDIFVPRDAPSSGLLRVRDFLYVYKLHGSITWRIRKPAGAFGADVLVDDRTPRTAGSELVLIYPTPEKDADALGYPYAVLLRGFAAAINHPDAALMVIGYGMRDWHINRIIGEALGHPSFQLMLVSPSVPAIGSGGDDLLDRLVNLPDRRISCLHGRVGGTLADLVDNSLPDVAPDSEMRQASSDASALLQGPPIDPSGG